jgi:pimeloyl-ACP methyl ester carboxylesterase
MPDAGENVGATAAGAPRTVLNDAMVVQDDGRVAIEPTLAVDAFYHDCDRAAAEAAVSKLRPQRFESYPILEDAPPWRSVPSTYVVCGDDRALAPSLQRALAGRAGAVVELQGAHSPFLAQPERVAELLMRLAR